MQTILIVFSSIVIGGGLAGATLVGVVNSQTSPPAKSPTSVNNPVINYGSTK